MEKLNELRNKNWFIFLVLILFAPAGIILMLKSDNNPFFRVVASVVGFIHLLFAFVSFSVGVAVFIFGASGLALLYTINEIIVYAIEKKRNGNASSKYIGIGVLSLFALFIAFIVALTHTPTENKLNNTPVPTAVDNPIYTSAPTVEPTQASTPEITPEPTTDITPEPAPTSVPDVTQAPAPVQTPPPTFIKAGQYKVGSDLGAGEYVLIADRMAYFQITSDSTGSFDSIISNDNFTGRSYITVSDGQYVEFTTAKMYPIADAPVVDKSSGNIPAGMYKVGVDFPGGEYKIFADSSSIDGLDAYFEVDSDSSHTFDSIISNDNFSGEKYITVSDGQYLKLVGCTMKLN